MKVLLVSSGMERTNNYNIDGESIRYDIDNVSASEEAIIILGEKLSYTYQHIYVTFPLSNNSKYNGVQYLNLYNKIDEKIIIDTILITDIFFRFDLLLEKIDFKNIRKIIIWLHTDKFTNKKGIIDLYHKLQLMLKRHIEAYIIYSYAFQNKLVKCPNGFKSIVIYKDLIEDILVESEKQKLILTLEHINLDINDYTIKLQNRKQCKFLVYKELSFAEFLICELQGIYTNFEFINIILEAMANSVIVIVKYDEYLFSVFKDTILYINQENNSPEIIINELNNKPEAKDHLRVNSLNFYNDISRYSINNIIQII